MANKNFKANWKEIKKLIDTGREGRSSIWKEFNELKKKVDAKLHEAWKEQEAKKENDRVAAIKAMPPGSDLFYAGNWSKLIGAAGKKVKDGRTRIVVDFGELGRWNCRNKEISHIAPTSIEISGRKIAAQIWERFLSTNS